MRVIFIFLLALVTTTQAQQINPVPDYIFRNQMSVGRNAVTDTAAYMSIGPRYGANKGLMPPIVVDTLTVTASPKRNGLLIFSVQKNKYVYWDSVRVQWSDMAGSSGSYIKGSGTIRYIPKFTDSITLGNSAMYDSSGFVRLYKNNIGNTFNHDIQTPVAGLTLVKDGMRGYPLIIQQNDSLVDNIQLAILLRKGLLVTDTIKNGYGVGLAMNLQNNQRTWVNSGWIANRIVDSASATFKSEMAFLVNNSNSTFYPLIVRPDSTIRVLKLSGSGVRNVVADANGDLSIGSATNSVDTLSIATRAWRQKGDDSLGAIIATKQNTLTNPVTGTGTTNYLPKWSSSSALTNSLIFDNGSNVSVGGTGATGFKFEVEGGLFNRLNATLAFSDTAKVGIGTAGPSDKLHVVGTGKFTGVLNTGSTSSVGIQMSPATAIRTTGDIYHDFGTGGTGTFNVRGGSGFGNYITVLNAGNVGIGNTSPSYKLDITGTLRNTTGAAFATSSGNVLVGTTTDGGSYKLDVQGALRNTTGAAFATSSGNVGIGTTSPLGKFHVRNEAGYNTVLSSLGGYSGIFSVNDANAYREMRIDGSFIYMNGFSAGETYVGIGTTDAGNYKLQVKGQMHSTGLTSVAVDSGALTVGTTLSGGNKLNVEGGMAVSGLSGFAITSGNVGIGQTGGNATEKLDIVGRARVRTIDSTSTAMNMLYADATGVIKKAAVPSGSGTITTAEADIASNYTVTATDHFVYLPALESAGRNVVLPNDAANGRVLIIFNTSNDGTYKWTFTNEDVEDAAGSAVTTLTNQKSYTMVYYAGKFRITAIN